MKTLNKIVTVLILTVIIFAGFLFWGSIPVSEATSTNSDCTITEGTNGVYVHEPNDSWHEGDPYIKFYPYEENTIGPSVENPTENVDPVEPSNPDTQPSVPNVQPNQPTVEEPLDGHCGYGDMMTPEFPWGRECYYGENGVRYYHYIDPQTDTPYYITIDDNGNVELHY